MHKEKIKIGKSLIFNQRVWDIQLEIDLYQIKII